MKNKLILSIFVLIIACMAACKKSDSTSVAGFTFPLSKCKLVYNDVYQSAGGGHTDSFTTRYSGDSIITLVNSYGFVSYYVVLLDKVNKRITERDFDNDLSNLVETATWYVNSSGYVDSIIRIRTSTGLVDYRDYITRNAGGKVTREIIDYITYGYDETYNYDATGNFTYSIYKSLYVGGPYNDSITYTYAAQYATLVPQYVLGELIGTYSKNLVASRTYYNRTTLALKKTITYSYVFDSDMNPVQITSTSGANMVVKNFQYNCN